MPFSLSINAFIRCNTPMMMKEWFPDAAQNSVCQRIRTTYSPIIPMSRKKFALLCHPPPPGCRKWPEARRLKFTCARRTYCTSQQLENLRNAAYGHFSTPSPPGNLQAPHVFRPQWDAPAAGILNKLQHSFLIVGQNTAKRQVIGSMVGTEDDI